MPAGSFSMSDDRQDTSTLDLALYSLFREKYWLKLMPVDVLAGFRKVILSAYVCQPHEVEGIQQEDVVDLFRLIGKKLTNLTHLEILGERSSEFDFPIQALSQLLSFRADTLVSVHIHAVCGTCEDLDMMLFNAAEAAKLDDLHLLWDNLPNFDSLIACWLKHLQMGLAELDLTIEFGNHESFSTGLAWHYFDGESKDQKKKGLKVQIDNLSRDNLQTFLDSKIPRLDFGYIRDIDSIADELGPALRRNNTLTELHCIDGYNDLESFSEFVGIRNAILVMEALEENSSLETLYLSAAWNVGELKVENALGLALSQAVEKTAALKCLRIDTFYNSCDEEDAAFHILIVMLRGLARNQTLQEVKVLETFFPQQCKNGVDNQRSFFLAVKDYFTSDEPFAALVIEEILGFELELESRNTTLRKFEIGMSLSIPVLSEKAKFMLELNGLGRKALFQNLADSKSWVDFLLQHKDDPRIVFYLISTNSSIFLDAYGSASAFVPGGNEANMMD